MLDRANNTLSNGFELCSKEDIKVYFDTTVQSVRNFIKPGTHINVLYSPSHDDSVTSGIISYGRLLVKDLSKIGVTSELMEYRFYRGIPDKSTNIFAIARPFPYYDFFQRACIDSGLGTPIDITNCVDSLTGNPTTCTALGILDYLEDRGISFKGKHCVVVGRGPTVGKPIVQLLLDRDATVTICHSKTEELEKKTTQADILISAVGKPGLITAKYVKAGAIVMDTGVSYINGKTVGDVKRDKKLLSKTPFVTETPGGVGLLSRARILRNVSQVLLERWVEDNERQWLH